MPDFVKLIAVFIIARMGGFHLPNLLIQFFFQFQIIFFRTFHADHPREGGDHGTR